MNALAKVGSMLLCCGALSGANCGGNGTTGTSRFGSWEGGGVRLFCYDASNLNIRLPLCPVLSLVFSSSNQLQCGASRGHL